MFARATPLRGGRGGLREERPRPSVGTGGKQGVGMRHRRKGTKVHGRLQCAGCNDRAICTSADAVTFSHSTPIEVPVLFPNCS